MTDKLETIRPTLNGWAYPSRQSYRVIATVVLRPSVTSETDTEDNLILDLVDEASNVLTSAPISQISIDAPIGSAPRRMTFPDGSLFETDDHETVQALTGETRGSLLHNLEQFSPRLIAIVMGCILGVWLLWRFGLDIIVTAAIALTPPAVVQQIDRGTLKTIDYTMAEETQLTDAEKAKVQKIFTRLLSHIDQDTIDHSEFKLLFRSMPGVGPNAFALPNGTVVITDEFVKEFGEDDILASVMGHEMGHVIEKHGLRQTYRSLSIYVLVAFLAGETGPFIEDLLLEGNLIMSLAYSRNHEGSADAFGVKLANDAGYDPNGLTTFFEWVSDNAAEPPQWLSTHPSSSDRVKEINSLIQALR